MKISLLLALSILTLTGSALAGQPKSNVVFNSKGQVINVLPVSPAAPVAGTACMSRACCAK